MVHIHDNLLTDVRIHRNTMSQTTLERSATAGTCPHCADVTVNVQGIRTCGTCDWFDR